MLWAGRLSPCFWAGCIAYSDYLWDRCGNSHIGSETTHWSIATGEIPRWDKIKVPGCQSFGNTSNSPYYTGPWCLLWAEPHFVGFGRGMDGWNFFDLETRYYFSHPPLGGGDWIIFRLLTFNSKGTSLPILTLYVAMVGAELPSRPRKGSPLLLVILTT